MQTRSLKWTLAATIVAAALAACNGSDKSYTSQPNPDALNPTGTIQGTLTDAVTQSPIQGATISIGVASATTDALGQFTLKNVPATLDAINETLSGAYVIAIDLQRANNVLETGAVYAKVAYSSVAVAYTSLDDTNGTVPGGGSGTNHDTPVTGIVKGISLTVGKLDATIDGVVADCKNVGPVGAGFTVQLVSTASDNSSTGAPGNVVATATTSDAGAFSFPNVEALRGFKICAFNADQSLANTPTCTSVVAPADRQTRILSIEAATAPKVCATDARGPAVASLTVEPGADLAPAAATAVGFHFAEAVDARNPLFSTIPGVPGNLFDNIEVVYAGQKSGNVAYDLAWNDAHDTLTVTFATAPSGKYYVRLKNMLGLQDANEKPATLGVCPDDSKVPGSYGLTVDADNDDCTVFFTTSGAPTAAAPTGLAVLNLNAIDASGAAQLDWLPATGAKKYDIYRTVYQWPGYPVPVTGALAATAEAGTTTLVQKGLTATEWTDAVIGLVESDSIPLAVVYTVKSVNSDGVESSAGVSVNVSDKISPRLTGFAFGAIDAAHHYGDQVTLEFGERMNEIAAETFANYTVTSFPGFTTPAIASAQYTGTSVTLVFDNIEYAVSSTGVCTTDVATAAASDDVQGLPPDAATCVRAGSDNTLSTTATGDDVACTGSTAALSGICAGADGVCNTTAAGGDVQATPAGSIPKCVLEGPNHRIDVPLAGADYLVSGFSGLKLGAGVTDVAGNPIDVTTDEVVTSPRRAVTAIR